MDDEEKNLLILHSNAGKVMSNLEVGVLAELSSGLKTGLNVSTVVCF